MPRPGGGVGLARTSAVAFSRPCIRTRFRVRVARSASRVWKLWTGSPCGVRLPLALARAAGDRRAGWTGEERWSLGSSSSKSKGARRASHVPLDVVGEHAQKDVGSHSVGQAMVDGPHLEVDALVAAEGALDAAEALVGPDRLRRREVGLGHVGADDVEAVEGGLFGDPRLIAAVAEAVFVDLGVEVLADLVGAQGAVGAGGDLVLAPQGALWAPCRFGDGLQLALGGVEKLLALAAPPGCQQRVPAHDQPLCGVQLGDAQFGHVPFVEDRQLQVALLHQRADRGRTQGR